MRLTRTHVEFWTARHRPKWADRVEQEAAAKRWWTPTPAIHACVNDHVDPKARVFRTRWPRSKQRLRQQPKDRTETHNLLALCQSYRKRGVLREELTRLATKPYPTDSKRRRATVVKWLRRLQQS
jgi:hypothetical protein